jgi:hypothetical protein
MYQWCPAQRTASVKCWLARTSPSRRMLPNFPYKLWQLVPIALAACLVQLLDIMGCLGLFALRIG